MKETFEYVKLALRNIRGNLLRTILTCLIIALGIGFLVGTQAAIGALSGQMSNVFSPLGANQLTVTNQDLGFTKANDIKKPNERISFENVENFKKKYNFPGKVTSYVYVPGIFEIRNKGEKTNPNYNIMGADENYLELENYKLGFGRNFNNGEIESGAAVAIVGGALVKDLFTEGEDIVNKNIGAGNQRYRVIGVLEEKGNSFNSNDRIIIVPNQNINRFYAGFKPNYTLKIGVNTPEEIAPATEEAFGAMRIARGLRTIDENDFSIREPGAANEDLKKIVSQLTLGGLVIGLITLTGAAIGLMNILLVSVTERIREIGVSKAIGATVGNIRFQYFIEGLVISLIGGLLGIVFAMIIGAAVSAGLKTKFTVPWDWIGIGLAICFAVGLVSSIYPAIKASLLNPIEALRNE